LLKSRAAKLLAVRCVTQDNQGKHTAGIDGIKSLTPSQRFALAQKLGTYHELYQFEVRTAELLDDSQGSPR
jgi:hypothetical protein